MQTSDNHQVHHQIFSSYNSRSGQDTGYGARMKKSIKLQPVPPSMPSEALSVLFLDIHSASSGIDGGTGCNFIFFYTRVHTIEAY